MAVPSHITRRAVLKAVPAIGAVALPLGTEAPDAAFSRLLSSMTDAQFDRFIALLAGARDKDA